jgi:ABC-type maltose transport system permease subunit
LNPEAWISGEQLDIISFFSFLQFFSFCMGLVCVWLLLLHLEAWNSSHGRLVLFYPQLPLLNLLVDSS